MEVTGGRAPGAGGYPPLMPNQPPSRPPSHRRTQPEPQTGRVLHLADRAAWASAQATGQYSGSARGRSLAEVGYVHASTSAQLPAVMAAVYDGVPADDLVLLVVDLPAVAARAIEVRWENLDGGTEPYPHLYGPIPVDSVVAALPLAPDDDALVLPDLAGLGVLEHPSLD